MASQPTISRFEQTASRTDLYRLSEGLLSLWLERLQERYGRRGPERLILDFDSTDDPTHGQQQLALFHGYYDQWMYHPLLVFDSEGWPLAAVLRPGNAHGSWGAVAVLERILGRLFERFPQVQVTVRADSGFAVPALYEFCEAADVSYQIGLVTNPRLVEAAKPLLAKARRQHESTGKTVQLFGVTRYRADSWTRSRRVVIKAEVMDKGENPRFVVTNLEEQPETIYRTYRARGQMENFIKDLKNALFADRLSCHRFLANQFRLLLHMAAYMLMFSLRETELAGTDLQHRQFDTIRLKLLKIGARIEVTARRIWVHLASSHPSQHMWRLAVHRLTASPA